MDTGWIITISTVASAAIVSLLVKNFLPSYLNEKAKNLATKEDVAAITDEVEKVKRQHASQLEMLRADLDQKKHVSNAQFERESLKLTNKFGKRLSMWTMPLGELRWCGLRPLTNRRQKRVPDWKNYRMLTTNSFKLRSNIARFMQPKFGLSSSACLRRSALSHTTS